VLNVKTILHRQHNLLSETAGLGSREQLRINPCPAWDRMG